MPKINEKGIELIRKTIQEADFTPSTPIFNGEVIPSVWYNKEHSKLYIINYTDEKQNHSVSIKKLGLKCGIYIDIFTGEEHNIENEFSVILNPHSSVAFKIK